MCEVLLSTKNMFFSMTPRTESHPICFVLTKLVLTSFFTTKITLLPPIGQQVTIKFRQQVLDGKMLLKLGVLVIQEDIINKSKMLLKLVA